MAPIDEEVLALREAIVRELRRLAGDTPDALPDDVKLKGILGRFGPLLESQVAHIDALAQVDLGAEGRAAQERVLEVLSRALHVPRMVVAMGEVLRQDTKSTALRPLQEDAARAAASIQRLARLWALRQAGLDAAMLDDDEEEDEDEVLEL